MANPFRLPSIKKFRNLDIDSEDRQAGLPSAGHLPSDKALSLHSLLNPAAPEDTTETPTPSDETPKSPRQARFKRLAGLMKK